MGNKILSIKKSHNQQLSVEKMCESWNAHHAATEMRLDLFRVEILDIQNVQLGFGALQDPLTVQHALLKVCWLLEQLVLCGDLSQFSLQWMKTRFVKISFTTHKPNCF